MPWFSRYLTTEHVNLFFFSLILYYDTRSFRGRERTRRSTRLAKMLIMASTSPLLWLAGEGLGVTLEKKPGEVPQRGGREQEQVRARFFRCPPSGRDWQVGPPPGH
jgi:hypothetical protein